jgi:hypothetical protein
MPSNCPEEARDSLSSFTESHPNLNTSLFIGTTSRFYFTFYNKHDKSNFVRSVNLCDFALIYLVCFHLILRDINVNGEHFEI